MCDSHDAVEQTDSNDPRSGYRLVEPWPVYPPGMQFEMGSGVAVDAAGVIYLFTRDIEHWAAHPLAMKDKMGKSSISMFDRAVDYLGKWGASDERGFALGAHTLYIEKDGTFWTTDRDGHTVRKYRPDGNLLLELGTFGKWGDDRSHFNGPTAVVVQSNGNIVVADGYWNSRLVWFFTREGEFIKSVGAWGRGPARVQHAARAGAGLAGSSARRRSLRRQLPRLHDRCRDRSPRTVRSRTPGCRPRIQRFDPDGNYIDEWTHIAPLSIAVYGNRIYASDKMRNLAILDEDTGEVLQRVDDIAIYIHQLAMDAHGDLYTASVYPEHAGEKRGVEGPSHRRWTRG